MKFSRDARAVQSIRKIERGGITIGEQHYTQSLALNHEQIIGEWSTPLDSLTADALAPVLEWQPEMLILGSGWGTARPPRDLVFELAKKGIGLEVMTTDAACRTFNILIGEGRQPAALLYIE